MDYAVIEFIRFGIADNVILLFAGMAMEKRIKKGIDKLLKRSPWALEVKSEVKFGIFIGMIANSVSDFAGGLVACNWLLAIGSFTGCMIVVIFGVKYAFNIKTNK